MCMTKIFGVCIVAAQLTHGEVKTSKHPLITSAGSYDGVSRDVSKFYKPKDNQISIGGDLYTHDTKISLGYNNGVKTDKYEKNDSLMVQVTKHHPISKNFSINTTAGYMLGGNESHSSCSDDYGRQYYCGNLTAWDDFQQPDNKANWNAGITFRYSF